MPSEGFTAWLSPLLSGSGKATALALSPSQSTDVLTCTGGQHTGPDGWREWQGWAQGGIDNWWDTGFQHLPANGTSCLGALPAARGTLVGEERPNACKCGELEASGFRMDSQTHQNMRKIAWKSKGNWEREKLIMLSFTFHFHALEKEMATHSSVLACRIPGTGEPGKLPSMGSHRVGHDWSDLAAAAANKDYIHIYLVLSTEQGTQDANPKMWLLPFYTL